jgi:hypothetical protein
MRRRHRRALAAYVREIADHMGLHDWTLTIRARPPDGYEDKHGWCKPTYGQHHAVLWFSDVLVDAGPRQIAYTVTHELLHVVLDRLDTVIQNGVDDLTGRPADTILHASWTYALEMTVDQLARTIARRWPDINWDARPDKRWIPKHPDADGDLTVDSRHIGLDCS